MSVDLRKRPEGATHLAIVIGEAYWYRHYDGVWDYWSGLCWCAVTQPAHGVAALELDSEAWTGEGLPPVGIEIEAFMMRNMHDTYEWRRAKVVHGGIPGSEREILVFDLESTAPAWVDEFRPIRTPEQIAAEAREAAIKEMQAVVGTVNAHPFAELYDAGYRRQVAP